jgi:hypothetical protein
MTRGRRQSMKPACSRWRTSERLRVEGSWRVPSLHALPKAHGPWGPPCPTGPPPAARPTNQLPARLRCKWTIHEQGNRARAGRARREAARGRALAGRPERSPGLRARILRRAKSVVHQSKLKTNPRRERDPHAVGSSLAEPNPLRSIPLPERTPALTSGAATERYRNAPSRRRVTDDPRGRGAIKKARTMELRGRLGAGRWGKGATNLRARWLALGSGRSGCVFACNL